jgi:serine protease Do
LIAHGKITRGYIGATIESLSDDLANSWGLGGRKGAQVTDVIPGGPAQKAGLQSGDVVVAVNGAPVKSNTEMTREVAKAQAGDVIHLDVFRDGKERTVDVHSGTRPSDAELAQNGGAQGDDQDGGGTPDHPAVLGAPVLGMQIAPLNASTRGQYSIPDTVKGGVVVQSVKGTSDAGDKGIQRGDVIVQAGDRDVATAGDLATAVADWKKAGRSAIPLSVRRNGQMLGFVPVKIDG